MQLASAASPGAAPRAAVRYTGQSYAPSKLAAMAGSSVGLSQSTFISQKSCFGCGSASERSFEFHEAPSRYIPSARR